MVTGWACRLVPPMNRILLFGIAMLACMGVGWAVLPEGWQAIRAFQNEEASTQYQLSRVSQREYITEINQALERSDVELAESLAEVARAHDIVLPADVLQRITQARSEEPSVAQDVWNGAIYAKGEGLAGQTAALLTPAGDFRDLFEQAKLYPDFDPVVTSLAVLGVTATVGAVVTAGTTLPALAPVKTGASILKMAKKAGGLSEKLLRELGQSARRAIDSDALSAFAQAAKRMRFKEAAASASRIFKADVVNGVENAAATVGAVFKGRGYKAALQTVRQSDSVDDIARFGRVAKTVAPKQYRGVITLTKWAGKSIWQALNALIPALAWISASIVWLVSSLYFAIRTSVLIRRHVIAHS